MSREKEEQLIQRLVNAVHAEKAIDKADWGEFVRFASTKIDFSEADEWYVDVYNSDWHGFGEIDEFPWSGIHSDRIDECIREYASYNYDDEDTISLFRELMESGVFDFYDDDFFLRAIVAGDGQSAWVMVRGIHHGQGGVEEHIEDIFPTPLAAEQNLRNAGYIFKGDTPSRRVDQFTDDQIIEMMQQARKAAIAMEKMGEMQIGELTVLTKREGSSMTSVWDEYLCLKRISWGQYELSIRRYEALAEAAEYYDEEQEDYVLPDVIDGVPVVGLEDDWIVGGELQFYNTNETVEFFELYSSEVREWLKGNRLDYEAVVGKISSIKVSRE